LAASSGRLKAVRPTWSARILVVEDEPFVRSVCARILRTAGHKVSLAEGGARALELFEQESFDLLITDVMMPGMTGAELVDRLRKKGTDVPVLFMSGYMERSMAQEGELPDGHLLRKPFTGDELTTGVRKLLDATR
jgi:CheY-like chemotaxis protein